MKKKCIICLSLFSLTLTCFGQYNLKKLIETKDEKQLHNYLIYWDMDFSTDWQLQKALIKEIDHFQKGYVLEWSKQDINKKIVRSYVFDIDGVYFTSYEKRFSNDTLVSQGPVVMKDRRIFHIDQVYPKAYTLQWQKFGKAGMDVGYWEFEVAHFEYEIFQDGKLSCIYRAEHLNHFDDLLKQTNQGKVNLVQGMDCLEIKRKSSN